MHEALCSLVILYSTAPAAVAFFFLGSFLRRPHETQKRTFDFTTQFPHHILPLPDRHPSTPLAVLYRLSDRLRRFRSTVHPSFRDFFVSSVCLFHLKLRFSPHVFLSLPFWLLFCFSSHNREPTTFHFGFRTYLPFSFVTASFACFALSASSSVCAPYPQQPAPAFLASCHPALRAFFVAFALRLEPPFRHLVAPAFVSDRSSLKARLLCVSGTIPISQNQLPRPYSQIRPNGYKRHQPQLVRASLSPKRFALFCTMKRVF